MRKAGIVLALVLAGAGCAEVGPGGRSPGAGPGERPSPSTSNLTLRLVATPEGPVARLTGAGRVIEGSPHTSCWTTPEGGLCVDGFPTAPETFLEAPRGSSLRLAGTAETVEVGLARLRPGDVAAEIQVVQDLPLEDGRAIIDVEPGEYLLQIFATFPEGDGAFSLGLRVLPAT